VSAECQRAGIGWQVGPNPATMGRTDEERIGQEVGIVVAGAMAVSPRWEPPSWEQIAEHRSRVYRLAYRLTGNQQDAEDLTQDVFVRVFRSLPTYRPGSFEGWLHRITTNLFLDHVRRRARQRSYPLEDWAADRLRGGIEPAQALHDAAFSHDVQVALDGLPPGYRAAVVLCDVEGLSYEEIAEVLNVKLGTVRSRIHRGRGLMRSSLAHRAPRRRTAEVARSR
jgi:RNA polymerase sigma factor (sigma-70 family)